MVCPFPPGPWQQTRKFRQACSTPVRFWCDGDISIREHATRVLRSLAGILGTNHARMAYEALSIIEFLGMIWLITARPRGYVKKDPQSL